MKIVRPFTRAAGLMSMGALSLVLPSGNALAQEEAVVEEVFVTGSRIGRDQFESASPVSVYTSEDFKNSSAMSIDEFLMRAPEFNGYALGVSTNNGNNGAKMIDLRGLGHKRTLVLINGRRQVGGFVGGSLDLGAVDLNSIPMALLERVEVLKDGASTIYGSDAIAGAINIILKKRFEGVEISGNAGYAERGWDGRSDKVSMIAGVADDNGGISFGIEYNNQEQFVQADRDWAVDALWPVRNSDTGAFEAQSQGSSNSRKIRGLSDVALAQIAAATGQAAGKNYIVDAATGLARPFDFGMDTYNYSPVNALVTPNERWQLTALGDRKMIDDSMFGSLGMFGEFSYTKRKSHQLLAPDASFDVADHEGLPNDFVPASNPFNPFGDNPNNPWGVSGEDVRVNRRFTETGGRLFSQNVDTFRFVAGFEGEINDYVGWDVSYVFADNQEVYETTNYHRFDRWATMVDPAKCTADPACVAATGPENALNPFQPFGGISQKELDYLLASSLKDIYETTMASFSLNVNGKFGSLPGGSVGWAVGYEERREEARIIPDEFSANGLTTGGALDPLNGEYNVDEVYAEISLPLLADIPGVKSLVLEASARYSDYDTSAGTSDNYRLGLDWAINDDVRLRAAYSTGFRAPNMVEYFTQATTFPISENWCEFSDERNDLSATGKANCQLLGYPGDYEQGGQYQATYDQDAAAENLKPEESVNWTAGVIWTPESIEGLKLTVDWYSIEVDDYIALPDYNFLVKTCLESVGFSSPACAAFPQGYGVSHYDDEDYGGITENATTTLGNLGKLETSGVDMVGNYSIPVSWGPISTLDLDLAVSYLDTYEKTFDLTGTVDYVGTAGSEYGFAVFPEWRYNTSVRVGDEHWSLAWKMRWIDESKDFYRPEELTDDGVAEEVLYHDLIANVKYDQVSVTLGVDNVTDEDPPQFHSGFNGRTAVGFYDVIGRRLWMGVTLTF
jgi:iron complex outermembrane recepter protein